MRYPTSNYPGVVCRKIQNDIASLDYDIIMVRRNSIGLSTDTGHE